MRKFGMASALLALAAISAWARQGPAAVSQDGPASAAAPSAVPSPQPFPDGSYPLGPGVAPPEISHAALAVYPTEAVPVRDWMTCELEVTVGADGVPANPHVVRSVGQTFDAAALEAVRQSKFAPGTWNGRAVAVRVRVYVGFWADHRPAIPEVEFRVDTPPHVLYSADPEYSAEAKRNKISGIVKMSVLVGADGLPTDLLVLAPVGHGLDEKALQCVGQWRFKPATRDGKPVAKRVVIEVNFKIYP